MKRGSRGHLEGYWRPPGHETDIDHNFHPKEFHNRSDGQCLTEDFYE